MASMPSIERASARRPPASMPQRAGAVNTFGAVSKTKAPPGKLAAQAPSSPCTSGSSRYISSP
jgi:hypothetical protein